MGNVRIDRLTKEFDGVVAVDDLSLEIADGEFLVLVGPSGCGKTTTLRCVAGLETPTEGHVYLDGKLLTYTEPQDRDIAMVFQNYALYPHMTVRGNLKFGLEEERLTDTEQNARVEETAELLDIADLLDRKPQALSGGQQQRVALGRAIVREPEVFLMDEPLANLDAKLRNQMRAELLRIQDDLGVTTVYVTHNQTEAMTMGDRIAVMNDGELQQVGTPLECYHRPGNRFVAEFIGEPTMNFFDVELSRNESDARRGAERNDGVELSRNDRLVGDAFEYPLSEDTLTDVGTPTDLILGVRPEDVELRARSEGEEFRASSGDEELRADPEGEEFRTRPEDEESGGRSEGVHDFPATVDIVEPTGDKTVVYLDFERRSSDGRPSEGGSLVAVVDGASPVGHGERVAVRLPEAAIHLFDAATGEAVRNRVLETDAEIARP